MEEVGREQLRAEKIYDEIVLALKSNETCLRERKDFVMCRATIVGRQGDPSFCNVQASKFMECHNNT